MKIIQISQKAFDELNTTLKCLLNPCFGKNEWALFDTNVIFKVV